jgi:hypothetical protein
MTATVVMPIKTAQTRPIAVVDDGAKGGGA